MILYLRTVHPSMLNCSLTHDLVLCLNISTNMSLSHEGGTHMRMKGHDDINISIVVVCDHRILSHIICDRNTTYICYTVQYTPCNDTLIQALLMLLSWA